MNKNTNIAPVKFRFIPSLALSFLAANSLGNGLKRLMRLVEYTAISLRISWAPVGSSSGAFDITETTAPTEYSAMWDAILMDHVETVPVGERWSVRSRLQDFGIHCECLNDGSLRIEIKNALEAILVSMVLFRFLTSRRQQVEWLERCWHSCAARGGEIL